MSGYQVDPALLRQHAANVGQIAGEVEHASDAANEEGIGGLSPYGVLFSPLAVPALGAVATLAKSMISGTGSLGREIQKSLSHNIDLYELVEQDATSKVKGVFS